MAGFKPALEPFYQQLATMIEIRSLGNVPFEDIFEAFSTAFEDYEVQLNAEQLSVMLHRRGFNKDLSFGAFHHNRLVSFTLNGIGEFNGIRTAYDTGSGTLKEFRGQGLATAIFKHCQPVLKASGISQYLLEVLQHNSQAASVYRKQGFEVSREFNYFICEMEKVMTGNASLPGNLILGPADLSMRSGMQACWDYSPSWQNSFEAVERKPEDFIFQGVFCDDRLVAYSIFEPVSGDITQLAVRHDFRRMGIGSVLLRKMLKLNKNRIMKLVNAEINCNSLTSFLQSHGINLSGKQFEMIKHL